MKFNMKLVQNVTTFAVFSALFLTYYNQIQTQNLSILDHLVFLIILFLIAFIYYIRYKHIQAIEKNAYYDELTGLPNLIKLKKDLQLLFKQYPNKEFAIVKVDIDNFKVINEIYNYEIGNKVLIAFAKTGDSVNENFFTIARGNGVDEFLLFGEKDFLSQLENLTEHYEAYFKKMVPEIENHQLSFKYGRYYIEPSDNDVNEIINKVTLAHKNAKYDNKNKIKDYDENLKRKLLTQTNIINKMEKALISNEFHAFLQPKFNLNDNTLVGAEALVRWIQADNTMIYPNDFIPVFESNGFILKLDSFILETICKTLRLWIDAGYDAVPVSINYSRVHLNNKNLVSDITTMLKKYDISHELIEIELTETAILDNADNHLTSLLNEFEDAGISVSVDDFGAGYSSLGLIKSIKPNIVKLDKSFLDNTSNTDRSKLVIQGIVNLVKSLDAHIVAEGVEDEVQANFLKSINCDTAQGYFYAKPMPIREFEEKYLENKL